MVLMVKDKDGLCLLNQIIDKPYMLQNIHLRLVICYLVYSEDMYVILYFFI